LKNTGGKLSGRGRLFIIRFMDKKYQSYGRQWKIDMYGVWLSSSLSHSSISCPLLHYIILSFTPML